MRNKNIMKKHFFLWVLLLGCFSVAIAQNNVSEITGIVVDDTKEPLIGVNIVIKDNPGLGTITDLDGKFRIKAAPYQVLVFSYVGYDKVEQPINSRKVIDVEMKMTAGSVLDEVTVTGTGVQKKATITGAITTVNMNTLKSSGGAALSISNALAGNVAGIIGMQTSGEPGKVSEFWIRGISTFGAHNTALILVDGFERSMDELNIEDIESFSILKDASATAIYGSRGANGVVLISTKRGKSGKVDIDVKVEGAYNTRTRTPEFVDGYTYASLRNEALITRNREPSYTPTEMEILRLGLDPYLYPNVDWSDMLLREGAWTERATMNISGGGTSARYYVSIAYLNQEGMYNTDSSLKNDYKTNANLSRWNYRMNADLNITPSTILSVGLGGSLQMQNMPGQGDDVWPALVRQTPVSIPFMYPNGRVPSVGTGNNMNPWAIATQTGYVENWENKIQTNVTLDQNLDFITKGLRFVGRYGFDTNNENRNVRIKRPELWRAAERRDPNGKLELERKAEEILMGQVSFNEGNRKENLELEFHYNKRFDKHDVGGTLKYFQYQEVRTANVGTDIMRAIARRAQGVSGRVTYAFEQRYFAEFNFGYTGSEIFQSGNQFGFFPAVSAGWNIVEEKFLKERLDWLDMFKVRYSYGEVGNDRIGDPNASDYQRFPYLSTFAPRDGWHYGDYNINPEQGYRGQHYSQVASPKLGWEIARKHNLGLDMSVLNGKFSLTVDVFQDTRESIYMRRNHLPQITGVDSKPWANVGKMRSKGIDGNFMLHDKVGKVDLTLRGNMTYTQSEILAFDEPANNYSYQMTEGFRHQQARGLIALGLFKDYDDIRNSPRQTFGEYMPGDIKYKDVNGDGVIDGNDVAPIGATKVPNLIYGLGASASWKNFDINVHFQGAGKSSYMINGSSVYAFSDGDTGNVLTDMAKPGNRWIAKEISGTPETENPNAKYPRLSHGGNGNNYRESSFWLRNGAYLRFKTLEMGYSLPKAWITKVRMTKARLYFQGNNLFVWDSLKLWDPELASGDGMKYPLAKTYTMGLNVTF